jgi:autonomous glycyl radical cofactor GrcA
MQVKKILAVSTLTNIDARITALLVKREAPVNRGFHLSNRVEDRLVRSIQDNSDL